MPKKKNRCTLVSLYLKKKNSTSYLKSEFKVVHGSGSGVRLEVFFFLRPAGKLTLAVLTLPTLTLSLQIYHEKVLHVE